MEKHELPNAPGFTYTGDSVKRQIIRGSRKVNLPTITDAGVKALLAEDQLYWSQKFTAKKTAATKKQNTTTSGNGDKD